MPTRSLRAKILRRAAKATDEKSIIKRSSKENY